MLDLPFSSAGRLAAEIRRKAISATELLDLYLRRIETYNPRINAIIATIIDAARARARDADAALAKGGPKGALHGVPLAHKDMYYDRGKVVTCGSKIRKDFVATTTSTAL